MTTEVSFAENDGIQSWGTKGHVDKAAFLAAVLADEDYQRCAETYDWPEPTEADIAHEVMCWDEDEPESVYYLPRCEPERQEAIRDGCNITEPAPWTWFSRESAWDSKAERQKRAAPADGATGGRP